eukprot:14292210-Alexandrium_andersonii.AAC.1
MRPAALPGPASPSILGNFLLRYAKGRRPLSQTLSQMAVASAQAPPSPQRAPLSSSSGADAP